MIVVVYIIAKTVRDSTRSRGKDWYSSQDSERGDFADQDTKEDINQADGAEDGPAHLEVIHGELTDAAIAAR